MEDAEIRQMVTNGESASSIIHRVMNSSPDMKLSIARDKIVRALVGDRARSEMFPPIMNTEICEREI